MDHTRASAAASPASPADAAAAASPSAPADAVPASPAPELVLLGGRVFTGTELSDTATAVLVRDGRIAAVGTDAEVLAAADPAAERLDCAGGLITPGFVDAHVHVAFGGRDLAGCDLSPADGPEEVLELIAAHLAEHGDEVRTQGWLTGGGWYKGHYPELTDRRPELDAVTGDIPTVLVNADRHASWANTAALEAMGIDAATQDPPTGYVERLADGTPTGILHEGAMDFAAAHLPAETPESARRALALGGAHMLAHGVTAWQEAILGDYGAYPDTTAAYRDAVADGTLPRAATGALWVPRTTTLETVDEVVARLVEVRAANAAAGFTTRAAKIMVDGVPENGTAAMLEPYCRCEIIGGRALADPDYLGLSYLTYDVLLAVSAALAAEDFDLHLHAIGDRAVRWSLDAVEHARATHPEAAGRHHIAHIQVVDPEDVPRFAAVGAAANLQALWAARDEQMSLLSIPVLGERRAGHQYPFASIAAAGGRLCMGSDWPVSSVDPWEAIHVAVNRVVPPSEDPDQDSLEPLLPHEALTLTAALTAYTSGSAWQLHLDGERGRIAPGFVADLAVTDRDPFSLPTTALGTVRNHLTLLDGRLVHDAR